MFEIIPSKLMNSAEHISNLELAIMASRPEGEVVLAAEGAVNGQDLQQTHDSAR